MGGSPAVKIERMSSNSSYGLYALENKLNKNAVEWKDASKRYCLRGRIRMTKTELKEKGMSNRLNQLDSVFRK